MKDKNNKIKIANRFIGKGQPIFIIAEAGVNHNGSLKMAKKMVDAAKAAGVDAVKFQTYKTEELVTHGAPKAAYQKRALPKNSQFAMLKRLELPETAFRQLLAHCRRKEIMFMSTPFDPTSAEFLNELGLQTFKIASGELTNIPLLKQIAAYGKPIILSTGMADLIEIRQAVAAIYASGNRKLALLHCTTNYPVSFSEVNLRAIDTLKQAFNVPVGYSDHTLGIEIAGAAAALGASIIEKHFTLDRSLSGPDHKASLTPGELSEMVRSIRNVQRSMGNGIKQAQGIERGNKRAVRKSIVAAVNIDQGVRITDEMLAIKRPGSGISPAFFSRISGSKARKNIKKDQLLSWDKVQK